MLNILNYIRHYKYMLNTLNNVLNYIGVKTLRTSVTTISNENSQISFYNSAFLRSLDAEVISRILLSTMTEVKTFARRRCEETNRPQT